MMVQSDCHNIICEDSHSYHENVLITSMKLCSRPILRSSWDDIDNVDTMKNVVVYIIWINISISDVKFNIP